MTNHINTQEDIKDCGFFPCRESFLENVIKFTEENYLEEKGSLKISINATYGSGKTFFVRKLEKKLEENPKNDILYINTWKSDFTKNPIIPIMASLVGCMEDKLKKTQFEEKKKSAMRMLSFLCESFNQSVAHITGVKVSENLENSDKRKDLRYQIGEVMFEEFNAHQKIFDDTEALIKDYLEKSKKEKLYIILDELDRCRPNYAIEFLETINHFFDIKNVIFIIPVDKDRLKSAMSTIYGVEMDFENYYLKFVDIQFYLPELYQKNIYGQNSEDHKMLLKYDPFNLSYNEFVCEFFELKARQVEHFRRLDISLKNLNIREGEKLIVRFLIAFHIKEYDFYKEFFKENNLSIEKIEEFFAFFEKKYKLFNEENSYLLKILFLGFLNVENSKLIVEKFKEKLKSLNLITDDDKINFQILNSNFGGAGIPDKSSIERILFILKMSMY